MSATCICGHSSDCHLAAAGLARDTQGRLREGPGARTAPCVRGSPCTGGREAAKALMLGICVARA
eukprot:366436-Chlamydomonas_euryale.AAC.30